MILGARQAHWCQLKVSLAVETAAIQTKPAQAGFKTVYFLLVRAGGLGFSSRDFQWPGLKLTPMRQAVPLLAQSMSPFYSDLGLSHHDYFISLPPALSGILYECLCVSVREAFLKGIKPLLLIA